MSIRSTVASLACLLCLAPLGATAATVSYLGDFAGFDAAAPGLGVVDFDATAPGTDLSGASVAGATLTNPDGNALLVVRGADTVSSPEGDTDNRLFPTSGENVLSPGGTLLDTTDGVLVQKDSLRITFAQPVAAFGLDVLFQSLDGASFVAVQVFDASNALIVSQSLSIPAVGNGADATSGSPRGGSYFVGFVSDFAEIGSVAFLESDDGQGNPDSNVGYDTFRFGAVPEPSTALLVALGLALATRSARPR
jgi:hypothetical protein